MIRFLIALGESVSALSPSFPLGARPPVGASQSTKNQRRSARVRRPRARICLRKGCGRGTSHTVRLNQRYCQQPHCLRQVHRWQAARRQAKHRQNLAAKARHAQAEREPPPTCLSSASQAVEDTEVVIAWSRNRTFFSLSLCDRPGCYEPPITSPRNPARYCGAACRQAIRNVKDRERKWLSRDTLDGRRKRSFEYQAARWRRVQKQDSLKNSSPLRAPPE